MFKPKYQVASSNMCPSPAQPMRYSTRHSLVERLGIWRVKARHSLSLSVFSANGSFVLIILNIYHKVINEQRNRGEMVLFC